MDKDEKAKTVVDQLTKYFENRIEVHMIETGCSYEEAVNWLIEDIMNDKPNN